MLQNLFRHSAIPGCARCKPLLSTMAPKRDPREQEPAVQWNHSWVSEMLTTSTTSQKFVGEDTLGHVLTHEDMHGPGYLATSEPITASEITSNVLRQMVNEKCLSMGNIDEVISKLRSHIGLLVQHPFYRIEDLARIYKMELIFISDSTARLNKTAQKASNHWKWALEERFVKTSILQRVRCHVVSGQDAEGFDKDVLRIIREVQEEQNLPRDLSAFPHLVICMWSDNDLCEKSTGTNETLGASESFLHNWAQSLNEIPLAGVIGPGNDVCFPNFSGRQPHIDAATDLLARVSEKPIVNPLALYLQWPKKTDGFHFDYLQPQVKSGMEEVIVSSIDFIMFIMNVKCIFQHNTSLWDHINITCHFPDTLLKLNLGNERSTRNAYSTTDYRHISGAIEIGEVPNPRPFNPNEHLRAALARFATLSGHTSTLAQTTILRLYQHFTLAQKAETKMDILDSISLSLNLGLIRKNATYLTRSQAKQCQEYDEPSIGFSLGALPHNQLVGPILNMALALHTDRSGEQHVSIAVKHRSKLNTAQKQGSENSRFHFANTCHTWVYISTDAIAHVTPHSSGNMVGDRPSSDPILGQAKASSSARYLSDQRRRTEEEKQKYVKMRLVSQPPPRVPNQQLTEQLAENSRIVDVRRVGPKPPSHPPPPMNVAPVLPGAVEQSLQAKIPLTLLKTKTDLPPTEAQIDMRVFLADTGQGGLIRRFDYTNDTIAVSLDAIARHGDPDHTQALYIDLTSKWLTGNGGRIILPSNPQGVASSVSRQSTGEPPAATTSTILTTNDRRWTYKDEYLHEHELLILNFGQPNQEIYLDAISVAQQQGNYAITDAEGHTLQLKQSHDGLEWDLYIDDLHSLEFPPAPVSSSARATCVTESEVDVPASSSAEATRADEPPKSVASPYKVTLSIGMRVYEPERDRHAQIADFDLDENPHHFVVHYSDTQRNDIRTIWSFQTMDGVYLMEQPEGIEHDKTLPSYNNIRLSQSARKTERNARPASSSQSAYDTAQTDGPASSSGPWAPATTQDYTAWIGIPATGEQRHCAIFSKTLSYCCRHVPGAHDDEGFVPLRTLMKLYHKHFKFYFERLKPWSRDWLVSHFQLIPENAPATQFVQKLIELVQLGGDKPRFRIKIDMKQMPGTFTDRFPSIRYFTAKSVLGFGTHGGHSGVAVDPLLMGWVEVFPEDLEEIHHCTFIYLKDLILSGGIVAGGNRRRNHRRCEVYASCIPWDAVRGPPTIPEGNGFKYICYYYAKKDGKYLYLDVCFLNSLARESGCRVWQSPSTAIIVTCPNDRIPPRAIHYIRDIRTGTIVYETRTTTSAALISHPPVEGPTLDFPDQPGQLLGLKHVNMQTVVLPKPNEPQEQVLIDLTNDTDRELLPENIREKAIEKALVQRPKSPPKLQAKRMPRYNTPTPRASTAASSSGPQGLPSGATTTTAIRPPAPPIPKQHERTLPQAQPQPKTPEKAVTPVRSRSMGSPKNPTPKLHQQIPYKGVPQVPPPQPKPVDGA